MSKELIDLIDKQILILNNINSGIEFRLPKWKDNAVKSLNKFLPSEDLQILQSINSNTWQEEQKACLEILNELRINNSENLDEVFFKKVQTKSPIKNTSVKSKKVFIVHGHDVLARTELARTLERIGLEAIVLHEQPNEGKTVIEKFERDASLVSFAIAILSPDDSGHPINKPDEARPRARQNVILELGYFSGILGRKNVVVLFKGDIEIPSDYLGVVYIPMDTSGAWQFSVAKELKRAGLNVDINKLI